MSRPYRTRPRSSGLISLRGPSNRIPNRFRNHFPDRWKMSETGNRNSLQASRLHSPSAGYLLLRGRKDRKTDAALVMIGSGSQTQISST